MPGLRSPVVLVLSALLLGLFLYTEAHRCIHGSLPRPEYDPVHLNYPSRTKRAEMAPIRIKAVYDWSDTQLTKSQQELMENVLVPEAIKWLQARLSVTRVEGNLFIKPSCKRKWESGVCSVAPTAPECGGTNIPPEYVKSIQYCTTSPTEDCQDSAGGAGAADTDFLLIVNAPSKGCDKGTLAFASHCNQDQNDRPISGHMTMCPSSFKGLSDPPTPYKIMQLVSTLVHEISHAMVFSDALYPYFRDESGQPRVPRGEDGSPAEGSEVGIITKKFDERGHKVTKIVTPAVLKAAREHFNCPDLNGAEVEDQGGEGSIGSHWEERLFYGEFLTSTDPFSRPSYSVLTAALFRDSGWYSVDYSQWQTLTYGHGAGCKFAREECMQGEKSQPVPSHPSFFCQPRADPYNICSGDRLSVAICSTEEYTKKIPDHYQWFDSASKGGSTEISDYCPRFSGESYNPSRNMDCLYRESADEDSATLEKIGLTSRCIMATVVKKGFVVKESHSGRCYPVSCKYDDAGGIKGVDISIGGATVSCTQEDDVVAFENEDIGSGKVTCPPFKLVCPEGGDCPNSCSGYGSCKDGKCICYPGFSGPSCSQLPTANHKRNIFELQDAVEETHRHIELSKRQTSPKAMQFGEGFNNELLNSGMEFSTDPVCLGHASKFLDLFPFRLTETSTYPAIYATILSSLASFLDTAQNEKVVTCFPQAALFVKALTSQTDPLLLKPMLRSLYLYSVQGKWEELGTTAAQITRKAGAIRKSAETVFHRVPRIPTGWECDDISYASGDGCDCDCGAPDPDCAGSNDPALLFNCLEGPLPKCINGTCSYGTAPSSWTCDELSYGTGDGCDCECGAYDPDCDLHPEDVWNCDDGDAKCSKSGHCVYQAVISSSWLCSLDAYNTKDYCDCNCGAWDPDCDIPTLPNDCLCPSQKCVKSNVNGTIQGVCVGTCIGVLSQLTTTTAPTPATPTPTPTPTTAPTPGPTTCPSPDSHSSSTVININFAQMLRGY